MKRECILKGLLLPIGFVAFFEHSSAADAEIAYVPILAQQFAQLGGIAVLFSILNPGAKGYTIAYTSDANGFGIIPDPDIIAFGFVVASDRQGREDEQRDQDSQLYFRHWYSLLLQDSLIHIVLIILVILTGM